MKMDKKTLVYAISACSVLIMFIWGWLEKSYAHSWLAILAGGAAIAAVSILDKNRDENGKVVWNAKTLPPIISMCSVLVMFIWGFIEGSFEHSWLAVMAGGILSGIVWRSGKSGDGDAESK